MQNKNGPILSVEQEAIVENKQTVAPNKQTVAPKRTWGTFNFILKFKFLQHKQSIGKV